MGWWGFHSGLPQSAILAEVVLCSRAENQDALTCCITLASVKSCKQVYKTKLLEIGSQKILGKKTWRSPALYACLSGNLEVSHKVTYSMHKGGRGAKCFPCHFHLALFACYYLLLPGAPSHGESKQCSHS